MHPVLPHVAADSGRLPLTLPGELWSSLSPAQQAVYRRAESLLDVFSIQRTVQLSRLLGEGPRAEVLRALQVLGGMSLVQFDSTGEETTITLRAVPDEHVRVTGPDGRPRWIFVARPLDPPQIAPEQLN